MTSPIWPEAMGVCAEFLFVVWFQKHPNDFLHEFITPCRDAHSTLPPHPNRPRDLSPSPIRIIPCGVSASRLFAFAEGTILT